MEKKYETDERGVQNKQKDLWIVQGKHRTFLPITVKFYGNKIICRNYPLLSLDHFTEMCILQWSNCNLSQADA